MACCEHFTSKLDYGALHTDASNVLLTLQSVEREVHSQDGKWYLARLGPYRTLEDRIDGVVLTFVDISSTREYEKRLSEQARILDLAHVMVHLSSDDRIVSWNKGCERLYGYTASEAIGKNCHELLQTEFPAPLAEIRAKLERTREWEGELVHKGRSGARVIVASHWLLSRSDGDTPAAILELNNDITARRQAEGALLVADQNKDRLLTMLSHELRNPLSAILNSFQLLVRSVPEASVRPERSAIERQLDNLKRIFDDLLELQRLTHGKIALARRKTNLSKVIESAVETIRADEPDAHDIKVNLPKNPIVLYADALRLTQVFSNLLQNSVRFTPRSGSIEISAEQTDSEAVVRIRDTGIGIRPELLLKLFDMYAQGEPLVGGDTKGLGVGLTLVRQIVELHGGKVAAYSAGLNQGCEIVVKLPLPAAGELHDSDDVVAQPQVVSAAARVLTRVMIVDDNDDSAEAVAALLEGSGFTVAVYHDGALGLEGSREFKPEAAILDIGLPGLDGYELGRQLRQENPDILLLALSGWRQDPASDHAKIFDHYLTKPIEISAIEKLLVRASRAN